MQTTNSRKIVALIRTSLGVLFLTTGAMKFTIPALRAAFSGQLIAASIPFHSLNMWIVPGVEIGLGVLLVLGLLPRFASLSAIALMLVATYVHLAVDDPALFPLQPEEPIIPVAVIAISTTLLWRESWPWNLMRQARRNAA